MTQRRENYKAKKDFTGTVGKQISLLDTISSMPDEQRKKLTTIQTRIIEKYEENPAVVDDDHVLILELWKDDGLYETLQRGSLSEFMYWFMFTATNPESIRRGRQLLTSDKNGPPVLMQSEEAKTSRQSSANKQKAWHRYWRNKDGGHIMPEHSLDYFTSRDGIDKHGRPPQESKTYDIGDF
ncbi:hypothetical protein CMI37_13325 [Candidatus Pacearchaeota archaeon]|nr:hypothetical protein [Candidatus Pacearchaeota archaeon]|tara:strand:- start:3705 stop:4250 length:546 start_codon:yes stop_codon:yes gene_type:complete